MKMQFFYHLATLISILILVLLLSQLIAQPYIYRTNAHAKQTTPPVNRRISKGSLTVCSPVMIVVAPNSAQATKKRYSKRLSNRVLRRLSNIDSSQMYFVRCDFHGNNCWVRTYSLSIVMGALKFHTYLSTQYVRSVKVGDGRHGCTKIHMGSHRYIMNWLVGSPSRSGDSRDCTPPDLCKSRHQAKQSPKPRRPPSHLDLPTRGSIVRQPLAPLQAVGTVLANAGEIRRPLFSLRCFLYHRNIQNARVCHVIPPNAARQRLSRVGPGTD